MAGPNGITDMPQMQRMATSGGERFSFADDSAPQAQQTPQAAQPTPNPASGMLLSPSDLQNFAPKPYQDFGSVPYLTPTSMNGATVDPAQNQQFYNQFAQQLATSMAPQFARDQQSLDASMAGRGIFNSGAAIQANTDLAGQHDAALANPLGQMTQQMAGYNQQDVLQNATNAQEAARFNATAANDASQYNANSYGNVTTQNMNNYNNFQNQLFQSAQGLQNRELDAWLGSYEPNYSSQSILNSGVGANANAYGNVFGPSLQAGEQQQQQAYNNLAMMAAGG